MTLIRQTPDDAPWEVVARAVFWNRDVALSTWRERILAGHKSYLPDSVARMSTKNFIRFLGRGRFLQCWPQIRTFPTPGASGLSGLDEAWSFMKTGTFNMPPEAALVSWPGRCKDVYDAIVHHQGASIYGVAVRGRGPVPTSSQSHPEHGAAGPGPELYRPDRSQTKAAPVHDEIGCPASAQRHPNSIGKPVPSRRPGARYEQRPHEFLITRWGRHSFNTTVHVAAILGHHHHWWNNGNFDDAST